MKNILITGAKGQVGRELRFLSKNYPEFRFDFFGSGELSPRVTWDGYQMFQSNIAPPGTYDVIIELEGGVIQDTSLSVTLSAVGITGTIVDAGSTAIENAFINVFGSNGFGFGTSGKQLCCAYKR